MKQTQRKWWQKEVIYQIYPRSFQDSNNDGIGDLQGIISRLDYLKELGITMIWLCPIFTSPMDDNGYDISDYLNIAEEYGTMEDIQELIQKAKEKGIQIILDLVLNHTSDEHPWFQSAITDMHSPYRDYYIFKEGSKVPNNWRSVFGGSVWDKIPGRDEYYFHSFGKKQPDLNWENPKLRNALYDMIRTWANLGVAGFRVDAITFIKKDLTYQSLASDGVDGLVKCTKAVRNHEGIEVFLKELKEKTFEQLDCMTVAEAAGLRYEQLKDFIGDDGFFSMIFDFKHADLDIASGSEWFIRKPWRVEDLKNKLLHSQMEVQKYGWAANFIENHDQPRATTKYLKEYAQNKDAIKMLGAMYFFLRGTPFIYQGQELGMSNFTRGNRSEFNDLSSLDQYDRSIEEGFTKEEALHFVNLRSRDNARTPFPWNDEDYAGFSSHTPWLGMNEEYKMVNAKQQVEDEQSIFHYYKHMIEFRQHSAYSDCLIYGWIEPIETTSKEIIAYRRTYENQIIDCYFNFTNTHIQEENHENYEVIFNNVETIQLDTHIHLQPFQAVLLKAKESTHE